VVWTAAAAESWRRREMQVMDCSWISASLPERSARRGDPGPTSDL